MSMISDSDHDPLQDLLSEVRGEQMTFDRDRWSQWSNTLGEWVEAYPAFGAGRLLRAKASRDGQDLQSGERLAQAAVFSSVPGRLFDLLFRAGIEGEIAAFAKAVEALEPEVETAMRLRWHPEGEADGLSMDGSGSAEATAEAVQDMPVERSHETAEVDAEDVVLPEKGTLAREMVLGAIERSIEKEIEEVRRAESDADVVIPASPEPPVETPAESEPQVNLSKLSPLARWALQRAAQTGFEAAAMAGAPAKKVETAAEHIEDVLSEGGAAGLPQGGLEQQAALIDLFIRNEPVISPIQPDVERPAIKELAKESLVEDTSLITETMARIYAAQGQLGRARRAYKLLALKYPEKSVYFAAQSKKLGRRGSDEPKTP